MTSEQSPEFDQSTAKMFGGLFILIAILAIGFWVFSLFGAPEGGSLPNENPSYPSVDRNEGLEELGPPRDPDGGVIDDPLGSDKIDVEILPSENDERDRQGTSKNPRRH